MGKLLRLLAVLTASWLVGCASTGDTIAGCGESSICPIVIYEKYPGVFATFPDRMQINHEATNVSLLWTFANQGRYGFVSTNSFDPDGVEFVDTTGKSLGIKTCYLNDKTKNELSYRFSGSYYRCDFVDDLPALKTARYRVKFHDIVKNSRLLVDPTVETTGGPGFESAARRPTPSVRPAVTTASVDRYPVEVGKDARIKLPSSDAVIVVWFTAGGLFGANAVSLYSDMNRTQLVDIRPCFTSTDSGAAASAPAPYYTCAIAGTANFKLYYSADYSVNGVAHSPGTGSIERP